ncbi:MAG: PrgI family protein [Ruminococcus sp.]|nr:PrgI family protein [Ruminococcus sp.]
MNIPINKNIEDYKEDVWKGMGKRGFISFIILCVGNLGGMVGMIFLAHINMIISLLLLFPFNAIVGIIGFFPVDKTGMGMKTYIRNIWRANFSPTLLYQTSEFQEETGPQDGEGKEEKGPRIREGKRPQKKREERIKRSKSK